MAAPQNFRSAFNGFNKEDVVQYLEYINTKHNNQVNQLTTELEELRAQLAQPNLDQLLLVDALREECANLTAKLEESEAARAVLEEQLAQQPASPVAVEAAPVAEPAPSALASEELEAYRRAERAEREARERAELVYYQANGVLSEAAVRVNDVAAQINPLADQAMAQLQALQDTIAASKQSLQDAAVIISTLRPDNT